MGFNPTADLDRIAASADFQRAPSTREEANELRAYLRARATRLEQDTNAVRALLGLNIGSYLEPRDEEPQAAEIATELPADFEDPEGLVQNLASRGTLSLRTAPQEGGAASGSKDDRNIQLVRDVERDRFLVDGTLLHGSDGFECVLSAIADKMAKRLRPLGLPHRHVEKCGGLHHLAKLVLRAVSRTESGGASFAVVRSVLDRSPSAAAAMNVVPLSDKAEPLQITLVPAASTHLSRRAFGLRVGLEAATTYALYSDDLESVFGEVAAVYCAEVFLPISPPPHAWTAEAVGLRREAGLVKLSVEPREEEAR